MRPDRSFVSRSHARANASSVSPRSRRTPSFTTPSGRVATVTAPGDATVDDVRASIADAMGHPGCRARVHVPGLAGEIAGAGAFRDHVPGPDPDPDPDGVFARLAVCGYARLRRKTRATHGASRPPTPAPPPARGDAPPPPGGSPGFRRRNYIREAPEEDDRRAGGPDPAAALDPLAVPVGGHRPKPALVLPLSDDEGEVVVTGAREAREARRRRDSGVPTREGGSAAAEELWSALDREAKAARRDADAETKNPPTFDPRLRTIAGGRAVPEAATAALVEAFMAEEAARRRGQAADGSAKARRKAPRAPAARRGARSARSLRGTNPNPNVSVRRTLRGTKPNPKPVRRTLRTLWTLRVTVRTLRETVRTRHPRRTPTRSRRPSSGWRVCTRRRRARRRSWRRSASARRGNTWSL